jgi:hypothetical protein
LVLIDRPFLDTNPFDAEPADPIALVPALITPLTTKAARALRRRLPLRDAPDGTVRWHTHGLPAAVAERRAARTRPVGAWRPPWIEPRGFQERMDRVGGLVTLTANPAVLRDYAAYIYTLGDYHHRGMAYAEVDCPNGEIQVFRDYQRRVSAARVARREVLTTLAATPAPDILNPLIWQRGMEIRHRPRHRPASHTAAARCPD